MRKGLHAIMRSTRTGLAHLIEPWVPWWLQVLADMDCMGPNVAPSVTMTQRMGHRTANFMGYTKVGGDRRGGCRGRGRSQAPVPALLSQWRTAWLTGSAVWQHGKH